LNVLERIFARKEDEVATAKGRVSESELRAQAGDAGPTRGFAAALAKASTPVALIAEVKKASPSKGVIRADFDAVNVAQAYERAGAHCLSVLTDVVGFQGSAENLKRARKATSLPCLRKDFLYDPYQVWEARAWGADAILLIATSLESSQIADLMGLAQSLGMDALVEVHDEQDVERALAAHATLVGVNNRNLADFTTDLSSTERLLPLFPEGTLKVSESALETQSDIQRVSSAGARAVLIGTTFCAAPDVESKVREVMAW
jgi:indole-3-glycerol phosphate synthase